MGYKELTYRELKYEELSIELFSNFNRHQEVTKCWRKENGKWVIKDISFIDDWSEEEYKMLVKYLKNTIKTKGIVYGAKKLYISSHSAVETQRFYKAMGCIEALEYSEKHVENEPCDCQLEYVI